MVDTYSSEQVSRFDNTIGAARTDPPTGYTAPVKPNPFPSAAKDFPLLVFDQRLFSGSLKVL